MRLRYVGLLLATTIAACSSSGGHETTDPITGIVAGQVTITLAKTTYSASELSPATGPGVRAMLVNTADQPFYSRIGDAFNGSADQSPLFVANGSDASLQREQGADWVAVSGMQLVEGVKVVTLVPGKSYELIAMSNAVTSGRYRIVVAYRESASGEPTRRVTSATFEIR